VLFESNKAIFDLETLTKTQLARRLATGSMSQGGGGQDSFPPTKSGAKKRCKSLARKIVGLDSLSGLDLIVGTSWNSH